jgi:hypothetical protein
VHNACRSRTEFTDRQVALHVEEGTLQACEADEREAYLAQCQLEGQQLAGAQMQQQHIYLAGLANAGSVEQPVSARSLSQLLCPASLRFLIPAVLGSEAEHPEHPSK